MKATRIIVMVGAAAVLVGLGIAFREARAARRINTSLAAALRRQDSMRKEAEQLERHRLELESNLIPLPHKTVAPRTPGLPFGPDASEAQHRMQRVMRSSSNLRYGPIFNQLGLSAEQREQVENIMIKSQATLADIRVSAANQGVSLTDPAIAELKQTEEAQSNSELSALLGADGAAQFQQYYRSSAAGQIVDAVAGKTLGSEPLSAAQGNQLTQILASASPDYQNGGSVNLNTLDWSTAENQAQRMLSPQQFAALQSTDADIQVPESD